MNDRVLTSPTVETGANFRLVNTFLMTHTPERRESIIDEIKMVKTEKGRDRDREKSRRDGGENVTRRSSSEGRESGRVISKEVTNFD